MKHIFRKISKPAILVLALTIGSAGLAFATVPDSQGVIHGCYRTNSGSLRIIDSDVQNCNNNETELTWNQTGPQGPPGSSGQGQTTTKRVSVPYQVGPPVDHSFVTFFGFGDFTVTCGEENNTGYSLKATYHNTSGETVNIHPDMNSNGSVFNVPDGETYVFDVGGGSRNLFYHEEDSASSKIGELFIFGELNYPECSYTAFGTSN